LEVGSVEIGQFIRKGLNFQFACWFGVQTNVVVSGQINQIVFVQGIEQLQSSRVFHMTE
jgi:hypothetical protein